MQLILTPIITRKPIASISVPPLKTSYKVGDIFDPTGMIIEVIDSDGTKYVYDDFIFTSDLTPFTCNVTEQILCFNFKNTFLKVSQPITIGTDIEPVIRPDYLHFIAYENNTTISFDAYATNQYPNIEYSKNGNDWFSWSGSQTEETLGSKTLKHTVFNAISLNRDETLYLRGSNPDGFCKKTNDATTHFITASGKFYGFGNLMSIIDSTCNTTTIPNEECFYGLFENNTGILLTPKFGATELKKKCYANMFKGCINLQATEKLEALTLAESCYFSMFYGCTNLVTPPEIAATVLAKSACMSMFSHCSNLRSTPDLIAESSVNFCYASMFDNCSSLRQANICLKAGGTPADQSIWYMFSGVGSTGVIKCHDIIKDALIDNSDDTTTGAALPTTWEIISLDN